MKRVSRDLCHQRSLSLKDRTSVSTPDLQTVRLTRRRFAKIAGAALLSPLAYQGLEAYGQSPTTSASNLRIALTSLGNQNMDPTSDLASNGKYFWEFAYDYLVGADLQTNLNPKYGIAEKWDVTTIGPGQKTV